ncbi:MAG: T9SS type A sorting domain-containing protein, partial [Ignavibacteriae bacterium]|nr:T9SS type A sorting domain-containing protein [Ignavibacteriota bacterium]
GAINHVSSALHSACNGCSGATVNYQSFALNDVANEFHVYSVNWSPDQITFLIDGVGFYTYNPAVKDVLTWPFYEEQYILLNVAMGGIAGPIDPNFDQSSMIIDYVRVYQNEALSLDEFSKESVSLYPNPVSDVLHIQTSQKIDAIEIYNPLGKLILKATKVENQLDLSALETGIYLIKLYSSDSAIMKKIIVK